MQIVIQAGKFEFGYIWHNSRLQCPVLANVVSMSAHLLIFTQMY